MKLHYYSLVFCILSAISLSASQAPSLVKFDDKDCEVITTSLDFRQGLRLKFQNAALKVICQNYRSALKTNNGIAQEIENLKAQLAQEKKEHTQFRQDIAAQEKAREEYNCHVIQESEARQELHRIEWEKRAEIKRQYDERTAKWKKEQEKVIAETEKGRLEYLAVLAEIEQMTTNNSTT